MCDQDNISAKSPYNSLVKSEKSESTNFSGTTLSESVSFYSDEGLAVGDSDDYGFYELEETDNTFLNSARLSLPQMQPYNTGIFSMPFVKTDLESKHSKDIKQASKVIFTFNIKCAPMSTRSFGSSLDGLSNIQVNSSVTGFRIVQDGSGEFPEFRVMLSIGPIQYVVWRRESDFAALVSATTYVASNKNNIKKALSIWKEISMKSFWRKNNLSVKYLTWKTLKMGDFLREFLFEIPMPSILEVFALDD